MIIQVDNEGRAVLRQLCDAALRQGGIANLDGINKILSLVTDIPAPKKPEKPEDNGKASDTAPK